ncbi:MAG: SgcJ/EcaC family oxidoreductase [Hyphomonadaceae bacterium]|nr:SgcJ/EcaC family oxidoreductase [Hyphomonadaceae bacterium]
MSTKWLSASVFLLLCLPAACTTTPHMSVAATQDTLEVTSVDRATFAAFFQKVDAAWNAHDPAAMAASNWDDAISINYVGALSPDQTTAITGLAALHKTFYSASVVKNEIELIRKITPDAVIVVTRIELTGDARRPGFVFHGRGTNLLTRRNGEWRVAAFQNTQLADGVN